MHATNTQIHKKSWTQVGFEQLVTDLAHLFQNKLSYDILAMYFIRIEESLGSSLRERYTEMYNELLRCEKMCWKLI